MVKLVVSTVNAVIYNWACTAGTTIKCHKLELVVDTCLYSETAINKLQSEPKADKMQQSTNSFYHKAM